MNPNVKKYVVIVLIVLVGGALLIGPLLQSDPVVPKPGGNPTVLGPQTPPLPAEFAFQQNLAVVSGGSQNVEIKVNQKDITSMEVNFDGTIIQKWDNPTANVSFPFTASVVGTYSIKLVMTLKDGSQRTDERALRVVSDITPARLEAQVIGNPLPHSESSFTQGLEFKDGRLYEGVGEYGRSRIIEVNLQSGEALRTMALDGSHFGEGITILGDKLYQLTWQNGKCLIYDYASQDDSFTLLSDKPYEGEGWGLCNNGTELIMSNGSEVIQFIDPETFEVKRTIEVFSDAGPIPQLNELEYMDGKIYANVYQKDFIIAIDPKTGKVLEIVDCSRLSLQGRGGNGLELNGIAKHDQTGEIYLTGKNWGSMFEVQFVPAPNP